MKQIKIIARIALKDSEEPKRKKCTYFDFHLNNLHAVYRSICKSSFRRAELTAVVLFFLISFLALVCHFIAVFSPHSFRSCGYKKHARRPLGHNFDCLIIYALFILQHFALRCHQQQSQVGARSNSRLVQRNDKSLNVKL